MEYTLFTKLAAEFVGTAVLMVFGNGAVANAELKNTKGYHAGWLNIAMGYGFGVMFPVLMFGGVSGAHINPAMTLAQAVNGMFPWNEVLPYIIAQLLGAVAGQLIVYVTYLPHYKDTDDAEAADRHAYHLCVRPAIPEGITGLTSMPDECRQSSK